VVAIATRPAAAGVADTPGARAFALRRAVPLYQDRLRE